MNSYNKNMNIYGDTGVGKTALIKLIALYYSARYYF